MDEPRPHKRCWEGGANGGAAGRATVAPVLALRSAPGHGTAAAALRRPSPPSSESQQLGRVIDSLQQEIEAIERQEAELQERERAHHAWQAAQAAAAAEREAWEKKRLAEQQEWERRRAEEERAWLERRQAEAAAWRHSCQQQCGQHAQPPAAVVAPHAPAAVASLQQAASMPCTIQPPPRSCSNGSAGGSGQATGTPTMRFSAPASYGISPVLALQGDSCSLDAEDMDAFDSADMRMAAQDPGASFSPHASAFGSQAVQAFAGQQSAFASQQTAFASRAPSCPAPLAASGEQALAGTLSLNGWGLCPSLLGAASLPTPASTADAETPDSEMTWPGLPGAVWGAPPASPKLQPPPSSPFASIMQRC